MEENQENINTFDKEDQVVNNELPKSAPKQATPVASSGPIDFTQLSGTAVGDKVSYERESLDGQEIVIERAELYDADVSKPAQKSLSGNCEYYSSNLIIYYDAKNKDDVQHREYISGVKQFVQRDKSLSEHQFWYDGGNTQSCALWEAVAKAKGIEPKDLSPLEFMGFLCNKPKAMIKLVKGTYPDPKTKKKVPWEKNLPEEFVA